MSTEKTSNADASGAAPAAPAAPPAATGTAPAAAAASTAPAKPAAAPSAPPAPPVAATPPPAPVKGDPEAIAKAKEALEDAQDELNEMDKWIEGAKIERQKRLLIAETAQAALDILQPRQTNSEAIQQYLAQQRANLEARRTQIERANAFEKENGFKLSALLPKRAPLDMAMARKTQRGTQRPGAK